MSDPAGVPPARVRRHRFSLVWLIPIVAIAVAGYLAYRQVSMEGPRITVTFKTGDGLVAGQTKVQHKAVVLGDVQAVRLSQDMQNVMVSIAMRREAEPYLTDQARFWVVRPRLSSGSISGIETLLSGSYIEMDPGEKKGGDREGAQAKREFTGLETPPAIRSGDPGRTFQIKADRLGSLGPGAPVFWRDIVVGEVLNYDIGDGTGPVTVTVFVRAPYDGFVREGSHFWNVSGLSVEVANGGVHIEVASLQAVLSGGLAFDTPRNEDRSKAAAPGTTFQLYRNYADAQSAGYKFQQGYVSFFTSSVRGLSKGAAVEFYGLQIGIVTDVGLDFDSASGSARVRVRYEVQPARVNIETPPTDDPMGMARKLVGQGMRAQLRTASFITGSMVLALDFQPDAKPAEPTMDGSDIVIPSTGGGLDNILAAASGIMAKVDRLPLDEIGANLNSTLRSASGAMGSVQELAHKAEQGLTPVLARLPTVMVQLQDAVAKAGRTFGALETGYGKESQFNRELERAMVQVGDTARSIRLLADYLDRHPEALVRGRTDYGNSR